MSDYPRVTPAAYRGPFVPDRVVAAVRIAAVAYAHWTYYEAFHRRWERVAPTTSLLEWAPPLGNHLTSQAFGLIEAVLIAVGLGCGRGWAMGLTALTCLSTVVLAFVKPSPLSTGWAGLVYLPILLYCALRLNGTFGPPTGAVGRRSSPR